MSSNRRIKVFKGSWGNSHASYFYTTVILYKNILLQKEGNPVAWYKRAFIVELWTEVHREKLNTQTQSKWPIWGIPTL